MLGWIICTEGKMACRLQPEVRMVCDVPFLILETGVPRRWWERRRLQRALADMEAQGVRRVVTEGAGAAELLVGSGLRPVDCAPLRRALLPRLLDWAEEQWQIPISRCAVRLCARQTDRDAAQAAFALARRARYLVLDTGVGQEALAEELQRRFGLGQGGGRVALEVCLDGARCCGAPVLYLGEEGLRRQRLELTASVLPQGSETAFSAIFQAGKLEISGIAVNFVEFCA